MGLGQTKIIFIACIVIVCYVIQGDGDTIGVNNGKMGDDLPPEEQVVTLLKNNNIGKYRIFKQEPTVFKAFANSEIEITVGVANFDLESIATSQDAANKWVADNIAGFYPATNFKYIAVGNEVVGKEDAAGYVEFLLPAMINIQTALEIAKLDGRIKVSTAHAATEIIRRFDPMRPSNGSFPDSVKEPMTSVLKFLQEHDSPFMANIYTYFTYDSDRDSYNLDYALLKPGAPATRDGDLIYTNLFDAMVDAIYSSMEAVGYASVPIVITESGWPSFGINEKASIATIENARAYNNNLIKHVLSTAGTPKRPGRSMETYIFALFNENLKSGDGTEKHYGLFYPNQTSVYPVDFYPRR